MHCFPTVCWLVICFPTVCRLVICFPTVCRLMFYSGSLSIRGSIFVSLPLSALHLLASMSFNSFYCFQILSEHLLHSEKNEKYGGVHSILRKCTSRLYLRLLIVPFWFLLWTLLVPTLLWVMCFSNSGMLF